MHKHAHKRGGRLTHTFRGIYIRTCSHSGGAYEKFSIWMQTCWIIMIFFLPLAVFLVSLLAGWLFFCAPNVVDAELQLLGIFRMRNAFARNLFFAPCCVTSIKCNQKKIYKRHEWNICTTYGRTHERFTDCISVSICIRIWKRICTCA